MRDNKNMVMLIPKGYIGRDQFTLENLMDLRVAMTWRMKMIDPDRAEKYHSTYNYTWPKTTLYFTAGDV